MTVEYQKKLCTVSTAGLFKVLLRWKGSFYKLLWKDFILFVVLFYAITYLYQLLNYSQQQQFLIVVKYCKKFSGSIPVNLVLGFYVSQIVSRFNEQFNALPWMMRLSLTLTTYIQGRDEGSRMMRRTIIRYLCLSYVLTMVSICRPVKKQFPSFKHLIDAGFLTENELKVLEGINTIYNKYFVPVVWATTIVEKARKEGKIKDSIYSCTIIEEISDIMIKMGKLFLYDWVTVPLVYTQVVTLVVYTYFVACLLGYQDLDSGSTELPVPVILFLLFFFYMGWLKVAEEMLNPFGEDDDDFDIIPLIELNLEMGYLMADELDNQMPPLTRDLFWDNTDAHIPYTAAAQKWRQSPFLGTAANLHIPENLHAFINYIPARLTRVTKPILESISIRNAGKNRMTSTDQQFCVNKNTSNNLHGDFLVHVTEDLLKEIDEEYQQSLTAILSPSSIVSLQLEEEEWQDMDDAE